MISIITFNPDINVLSSSILKLIKSDFNIIIMDNNSSNFREIKKRFQNIKNLKFISKSENLGLSVRLNEIFRSAIKDKFDYVLYLDQDSIVSDLLISEYEKNASLFTILVSNYKERMIKNHKNRKFNKNLPPILSGSLISTKTWLRIGAFDENLFIDGIDFDFFYRANKSGISIIRVPNVWISHQIGEGKYVGFLFFKIYTQNHNSFRKRNIAFSLVYLSRKNKSFFYKIKKYLSLMKLIIFVFIEPNSLEKSIEIMKGIKDGYSKSVIINL